MIHISEVFWIKGYLDEKRFIDSLDDDRGACARATISAFVKHFWTIPGGFNADYHRGTVDAWLDAVGC